MTRQSQKIKLLEILNDLVKIHDDRISGYKQAISRSINVDSGLRNEIGKTISDGEYCKQELLQKIKVLTDNNATSSRNHGRIYDAWRDLKSKFLGNAQKSIIDYSLYNETIALYAFEAALDNSI